MINIVIDTCVLVAALKSNRGASFRILSSIRSGKYNFYLSTALVLEYEDVLKRSEHKLKLSEPEIDKLIDILCLLGKHQRIYFQWRPVLSDGNDDFVGELAINAKVDMIVTHNIKDFQNLKKFGVNVVTPQDFLILIGGNL